MPIRLRQCVACDVELNGETDDEDVDNGETGFDDGRNIRDPGQANEKRTQRAHEHTSTLSE